MKYKQQTTDNRPKLGLCVCWKLFLCLGLWSLVFGLQSAGANAPADFAQATGFYKEGKFQEAAQAYEELVEGADSAKAKAMLCFNAANSYYRLGDLSRSILQYERALAFNPWYADARYNLNMVRSKIEYKIEDRRNPFIRIHDLILKWVTLKQLVTVTLFFCFLFLVFCGVRLLRASQHSFWSFPRLELFMVLLFLGLVCMAQWAYQKTYVEAIVLASEADVRYGPSVDNQGLMKLGGGLKVFVVDEREDWSRVVTWNGETGWMRNSDIGRIDY